MAYTLAHMAAALPFYRNNSQGNSLSWLNFEALLIGTMMPDLPYYIGNLFIDFGSNEKAWVVSHHWISLLTYSLPWGLVLFLIWRYWFKPSIISIITPFFFNTTFGLYGFKHSQVKTKQNYNNKYLRVLKNLLLPVSISIVLGASTHLIWDGITDADGFIAKNIDFLLIWLDLPVLGKVQLTRFLQVFTSLIAIISLLWFSIVILRKYIRNELLIDNTARNPESSFKTTGSPSSALKDYNYFIVFNKTQSSILIAFMISASLLIGLKESFRFYNLLDSQAYSFAAQVLIRWLRKTAFIILLYTLYYHLISWVHRYRNL